MTEKTADDLIALNQRLLDAIAAGDWDTYSELCHPTLTAFEPEGRGHVIEGLDFHKFYFDLGTGSGPRRTTMCGANVRMLSPDAAVVAYVRLVQRLAADGAPVTSSFEETRVWQRIDGTWRHVHFHRSPLG